MNPLINPIGGYFELELPESSGHFYSQALKFQSARAAFYALIETGKPQRVWMPKYICDSMLLPLQALKIEVVFYDLNEQLGVCHSVQLSENDWLLYVNYFGMCNAQEVDLLKRFNPNQLIFDHAQAFYAPPRNCLATIYSPRKFFGVPDGGYLVTELPVIEPETIDTQSVSRCTHLLQRLDGDIAAGYKSFQTTEASFDDVLPRKMSTLTSKMLASFDYQVIKNKRNANFQFLHENFVQMNSLEIAIETIDGALCYPLLLEDLTTRSRLLENKIFVATYWADVKNRTDVDSLEWKLTEKCLPIPCDQRYDRNDLTNIVKCLTE
jgi:hypothetical protein